MIAVAALAGTAAFGCTIFVLIDDTHTLFFNNEDWSNPEARIWFIPGTEGRFGCAYLGFDDGWAQGGVNSAGLAFDWVAHPPEPYTPAAKLARVRGNSAQRMLETCASVDEAMQFYRTHRETEFARANVLIADRHGRSVVIGAKNGELTMRPEESSRGIGFGYSTLKRRLASNPKPTVETGAAILRECLQAGSTPTQYSNVFDLRSGTIVIYPRPSSEAGVELDLPTELAKGGHSYDVHQLGSQVGSLRPLRNEQKRFYLDEFRPLEKRAAVVSTEAAIGRFLASCAQGKMRVEDCTPTFWEKTGSSKHEMQAQLVALGALSKIELVQESPAENGSAYRCIAVFSGARVLLRFDFDASRRVAGIATEFVELERP